MTAKTTFPFSSWHFNPPGAFLISPYDLKCIFVHYFLTAISLLIGLPFLENFSSYSVITFPLLSASQ